MKFESSDEKYLLNSHEMCLVGVKKYPNLKVVEY